jgi:hypothetical protein
VIAFGSPQQVTVATPRSGYRRRRCGRYPIALFIMPPNSHCIFPARWQVRNGPQLGEESGDDCWAFTKTAGRCANGRSKSVGRAISLALMSRSASDQRPQPLDEILLQIRCRCSYERFPDASFGCGLRASNDAGSVCIDWRAGFHTPQPGAELPQPFAVRIVLPIRLCCGR